MRFLVHLLITAAALWVATKIVPGIQYTGSFLTLLGVALVFGALNALVKPVLLVLSLPVMILTLGLFTLILNALLLWLTSAFSSALGLGFHVNGFVAAFLGALVVSVISFVLSIIAPD
jgi:putative membrane protein